MTTSTEPVAAAVSANTSLQEPPSSLDFYAQSRPVQDRFLASASGRGLPQAYLFSPASSNKALGWLALAILAPLGLIGVLLLGLGQLDHSLALQPAGFGAVHALLGGFAAAGIAGYRHVRAHNSRFPYRLGSYVFPVGVVEAENAKLKVLPFVNLLSLEQRGGEAVFRFPVGSYAFKLAKGQNIDELKQQVEAWKEQYQLAMERQNRRELAVLDPLRDSGFSNPLSSTVPFARPKDRKLLKVVLALVAGGAIGVVFFLARNKLGERLIYRTAVEENTKAAYLSYLERGGKRTEVRQTLLPTAELAEARGSLAEVERYSEQHPDSAIRPQIDLALREEMLKELDSVREKGSLGAILKFREQHPRHALVTAELAQARSDVYKEAVNKYQAESIAGDKVKAFFVDLIRYSEKHGPRVEVRVRRETPSSHERADSSIRKSAYYVGPSGLPSQYFTEEHARPRETDATKQIVEALQQGFSKEILEFAGGAPVSSEGELPEVDVPTLFITYRPEMSGGYTTQRPRGVYVGIGFMVYTRFVIPDHDKPLNIRKQSWWLPPDVTQIWRDQLSPAQVYDQSAREGFRRYVEKLLLILKPHAAESEGSEAEIDNDSE